MKRETQITLCRDALRLIDSGQPFRAVDVYEEAVEVYTSTALLHKETSRLFGQYPLLAGFSCELADRGRYLTIDDLKTPIVVVRDDDGKLNAFVNTCRHRGTKLVGGCGKLKAGLTCPYHAWTYNLRGELIAVPDQDSFPGLNKAERPLVKLPVVEKYGMVWVCPTPGAEFDIDQQLGGLAPELESYGFPSFHHYERRVLHHKMNWKMMIDTFLEPYHFSTLHKNTVAPLFFNNLCLFEGFGQNLRMAVIRRSIEQLRGRPEHEWDFMKHSALAYSLFPNVLMVYQIDHVELWRSYPVNDSPNECVVYLDFYTPEPVITESAKRHWDNNMDLAVRTVVQEDFPTSEGIQVGAQSGAVTHSIYGRNEPAIAHFHKQIAKSLAG